jgi:hypothetical protein
MAPYIHENSVGCRIHTDPFHPEWLAAGGEASESGAKCCTTLYALQV